MFTSRLFRWTLALLGIRHQRIEPHCPWQNGRVERFFGTLKAKLDRWAVEGIEQLEPALDDFLDWYNHVRPHQHLGGQRPLDIPASHPRQIPLADRLARERRPPSRTVVFALSVSPHSRCPNYRRR